MIDIKSVLLDTSINPTLLPTIFLALRRGVDLALWRRVAQEAIRRASAAECGFGRLGRERVAMDFARELAEFAEKEAVQLRKLTASLAFELKP